MAPSKPHWQQPSHPDIQEVIINDGDFASKSLTKVAVAPFGVFAGLTFPPCTVEEQPTYATVQIGRDQHINLNSDLLYMNHSCEPSLVSSLCHARPEAVIRGSRREREEWRERKGGNRYAL